MSEIPMSSERDSCRTDASLPPLFRRIRWSLASCGLLAVCLPGCMSALTATTLREALRETAASLSTPHDLDHAAEVATSARPADEADDDDADDAVAGATGGETRDGDGEALEEVIDNAVARLSAAGGIDPATQELLIQTLEKTPPQDWAVVVNEFAATLEAARGTGAPRSDRRADETPRESIGGLIMPPDEPPAAAPALLDTRGTAPAPMIATAVVEPRAAPVVADSAPASAPAPAALPAVAIEPAPAQPAAPEVVPAVHHVAIPAPPEPESFADEPPAPPAPSAPAASVAETAAPAGPVVANACFATRVRGWGQVDRFPAAAFRPGQEVIVYFELDNLRVRASEAGHSTSIDTSFRLVSPTGERVGQWTFEPIEETCPAPRRDYFARYFIRVPEQARPGRHRLEWSVTDTLAGATRQAHLDFEILAAD